MKALDFSKAALCDRQQRRLCAAMMRRDTQTSVETNWKSCGRLNEWSAQTSFFFQHACATHRRRRMVPRRHRCHRRYTAFPDTCCIAESNRRRCRSASFNCKRIFPCSPLSRTSSQRHPLQITVRAFSRSPGPLEKRWRSAGALEPSCESGAGDPLEKPKWLQVEVASWLCCYITRYL